MQAIIKYFPGLSAVQQQQFENLDGIYKYWNQRINLISRKDIGHFVIHHLLHSLAIAKFIHFKPGTKILDIGTGGGFPGIPLAIYFPECHFMLVDSIGKKIKVVNEVIESSGLTNATAIQARAEKLNGKFDFVTSRAVTRFDKFHELVQGLIGRKSRNELPNGILYLKGGDFYNEVKAYHRQITIFDIHDFFEEDFFLTKKIIYLPV